MDLSSLKLFDMANRKMDWLVQRQEVLAQNVANADTPDYMSRDITKIDFSEELRKPGNVSLAVTRRNHMKPHMHQVRATLTNTMHSKGTLPEGDTYNVRQDRKSYEMSVDKNGVILEEQMVKVSNSRHEYEATTSIYKKHMQMLRTAMRRVPQ